MQPTIITAKSVLFVGDPHAASRGPGSRVDDFPRTVLGKLRQAFELARQNGAIVAITGDLFHRATEGSHALVDQLFELFWEYRDLNLFCLPGNHDKREVVDLTEGTTLRMVFASRLIKKLDRAGVPVCINGESFQLRGIAHGEFLPERLELPSILVTHHDLAFPKLAYPGTRPLPSIEGAVIAVNGHIHMASEGPTIVGQTEWYNPGNITRVSRSEMDNVPGVLLWAPGKPAERIPLRFEPAATAFQAVTTTEAASAEEVVTAGRFAQLVAAEGEMNVKKTADGSFLRSVMATVLDAAEAPAPERLALEELMVAAIAATEAN